ncbi:MAG: hypothetical protein UX09_C0010G0002 [Candidatus Uhrbacteria bacterium GW2011_GWE2_45_35]|uniref:Uncharacterized protein n=2 Tax=Candidatus Uhriibacteriota TaxID=1752732 RepID=A0A0G1LHX3_9BACT|nr:MAG: hypothetical protein UW63_C0079G0002 [Candidatus Uhrbacteria bacterium GW2011_GWF2_44_350]KKU08848.1 MAG: hypothetical protein UX09_C0010G0002 [Candidatus Uhrbacteria bacterium GW2011_GWE2_45_35]HBR80655.1 hypothetical protein [Candidatus Uhrbacteria bacterium]HCU31863.1 hypothetical protein [Candidatus Uhrbacteria bacterium]
MTGKKKTLIIGAVILLIALLILFVWFLLNQKPTPKTVVVTNEVTTQPTSERQSNNPEIISPIVEEIQPSGLESLAKTFSERYGSYSSESDFANLSDVLPLMNSTLRAQTENFIETAKQSGEYYGVTTRVLSVSIVSLDEENGSASLEISTQREESIGGPENSVVKYQKLFLNYVMEGEVWKVSSTRWE